ncbi:PAS domain-containing sensor histidine kinase [Halovenus marina]|uniref:PAS domain-containing sensor histidine kinase n=1 Tax=Halovenus marina TaxID=3396621 RepID=UPI003F562C59
MEDIDEPADSEAIDESGGDELFVVDADGNRIGSLREVTDSHRRELERYRTLLNSVDDAVYMTDENRQFTWVNQAMSERYGYDREEFVGSSIMEFLDDEQVKIAKENLAHLVDEDSPDVITFEMETQRKDGTTIPVETRSTLLPGETFTGTVGIIRDISERTKRERKLEAKTDRLQEFADTVSHDLRNPLTVAINRLELAQQECESQHLSAVAEAHERMSDLIEELLALTRQDEQVASTEPVELARLARASWATVSTADAELVVEDNPTVEGNPTRVQEGLENLFRNAVEHGGSDVTVRVGAMDEQAGFYVEDDGPGIPAAERQKVLEAGYTTDDDGTGFGLNIVRKIADAHDWGLRIQESDEGGARFEFATEG